MGEIVDMRHPPGFTDPAHPDHVCLFSFGSVPTAYTR